MRTWRVLATAVVVALVSVYVAFAAISLSTTTAYTQNFDSLGTPISSPTPSSLPVDWRVQTLSAVRAISAFSSAFTETTRVGGANLSTTAANGSYNFGAGTATLGNSDRAPGFLASGTATMSGNLFAQMVNNTGGALTGLQISYDVEKYRNGSNPAGFRIQVFYSLDGNVWTNAGPSFFTAFAPDADNNGFATAPGATVSVSNKTLSVSVPAGGNVYLAWNYSVTSGTTTTNAQALAIDNVSVLGIGAVAPTAPSGTGNANPNSILPGATSTLTVAVTPGANPPSTSLAVTANLSSIGGSATQQFFDDGVSGGDVTAGDNVFTYTAVVPSLTTPGAKALPFTVTDAQSRSSNGSISLTIQQPPPPVDHLVISQLYGGGGNSGATFTNDYVELYNPTGVSFNLAGWSLQYASAAGTSWTNKQPLGGTIAPGEYFLVSLASGGANGSPLPVTPNISGDINMSATTGKIALVSNAISLSGGCPNGVDPDVVDFVGYGSSATCFEGAARATAPSNTTALFRKLNGTQDTNQNGDDFQTATPNPRRTAPIVELGPWVASTDPISDGFNVPYDDTISVDFSEPVDVTGSWFDITCANSGSHNNATVASYNGAKGYHITPNTSFQFGEQCTVTILHANVHDQDLDDSAPNTDALFADYSWSFTVVAAGAPAPYPPSVHLTFGNPSNAAADISQPNNYLMEKPSFALSYNRDRGTPNWVSWHLETDWTGSLPRTDTFRADPAVSPDWYRVQSTDYFSSGFDRGHMTPNADRDNAASIPLNQETFLMSNMVPQAPNNNQGPWADFESYLRTLLTTNEVYVIAGPAGVGGSGDNGPANTIAGGHVTVPAYTWKVALVLPVGDNDVSRVTAATRTIAVIMPNQNSINSDWHTYLTTVDAVEALTGYDFFANVPDAIESSIEAGVDGNNPPGTEDQSVITDEDIAVGITLNAVSPSLSPSFNYTIVTPPANGVLSGTGPTFTYTPAANFNGSDSFTFRVNDGSHDSNTSTVSITVNPVNDMPEADSQSVSTDSNTPVAITLSGSDAETPTANLDFEVTVAPSHGTLSGSGTNLTYTPDPNYSGPDSFRFTVRDTGDGLAPAKTTPDATVSITVNDKVAPTIQAPAKLGVITGDGATTCGTLVTDEQLGSPIASDNTGSVTVERTGVPAGNIFPTGTTTITYTATDAAGNSTTATQTVTVTDTTAPTVTGPAPLSANAGPTGQAAVPNVLAGTTASDNCGPVTLSQDPVAGTMVGVGPHTITITATDSAGNSRTTTTAFTVNDITAPTLSAPANVTVNTGAGAVSCGAVVTEAQLGSANATDNAGSASIERSGVPSGNVFPVGTTTVTYTATDAAGNTTTATQTVTVVDNTLPTVTGPAPLSANAGPTGQAAVPNVLAGTTASDNCGPVTLSQDPVAGTMVGVGPHTITITATDSAGNSRSTTVTFTVNDITAPTLSAPANVTVNTGAGAISCGAVVTEAQLGSANATDNAGSVSIERSGVPSGNIFPVGTTTITYTATDAAGNTTQATQTVTVIDNTPPSLTAPPPTTVDGGSSGQAAVPNVLAGTTASDNCGLVTLSQSPAAGTLVGVGVHTITITARDSVGNTSSTTTTFTVTGGGVSFTFTVSETSVKRGPGKPVKIDINFSNTTGALQSVSFVLRYSSPCGSGVADSGGPWPINAGADRNVNAQFKVPKDGCTGVYTLTLESYVNGVLIGTSTAQVTVTP